MELKVLRPTSSSMWIQTVSWAADSAASLQAWAIFVRFAGWSTVGELLDESSFNRWWTVCCKWRQHTWNTVLCNSSQLHGEENGPSLLAHRVHGSHETEKGYERGVQNVTKETNLGHMGEKEGSNTANVWHFPSNNCLIERRPQFKHPVAIVDPLTPCIERYSFFCWRR